MKRSFIGLAAALLAFLIGVTLAMLNHRPGHNPPENSASQPASAPGSGEFRMDVVNMFRGCEFAGSRIARDERDTCPFELKESRPFPEGLDEGRRYVFHCRDFADRDAQFDALQEHLKLSGIESSVSGTFFSGGRVHPDFLLFQGRGYVGNIDGNSHSTYSQGGEPSPSWEVSDYVLTLVKVPE